VSEQTIPNILSIYHFKPDEVLFVTTHKMEQLHKTDHIINALNQVGIELKSQEKVIVLEDSLLDCKKKIEKWIAGKEEDEFTVNLTCGTKIMSIAAYDYFKDYCSQMIYIPVGENYFITPYPKKVVQTPVQLKLRLTVEQYLSAYGLRVVNLTKISENHSNAEKRKDISNWIIKNYDSIKPLLERLGEKLRKHRNEKKGFQWNSSNIQVRSEEEKFFHMFEFDYINGNYTKHFTQSDIIYITGGWLEEFCYNELLPFKDYGIDDIVIGICLEAGGRTNEFDVMFTKDNALYTVECKSLDQNDDRKTDALYKIGALQKDFGLRAESFFVSTSPHILSDGRLRQSVQARAEQFKTTVIPPNEVRRFAEIVAKKLSIK